MEVQHIPHQGLLAWFDAYRACNPATGRKWLAGETITAWNDLSGNSNHLNAVLTYRGVMKAGLPAVTKGTYESPAMPFPGDQTLVAVMSVPVLNSWCFGVGLDCWSVLDFGYAIGTALYCNAFGNPDNRSLGVSLNTPTCFVVRIQRNAALLASINGAFALNFSTTKLMPVNNGSITLGCRHSNISRTNGFADTGGANMTWNYQEIGVYNRYLRDVEVARVSRLLCHKWNIAYQGA